MIEFKPAVDPSYDQFKAFHWLITARSIVTPYGGCMVLFDSNELIVTRIPDPQHRGHYDLLGIELLMSSEVEFPMYTPDGTQVPKAWLEQGGATYLLHDLATSRMVKLAWATIDMPPSHIPRRFQGRCMAYIGGPNCAPVGGKNIELSRPVKSLFSREEIEHANQIIRTAKAALKLENHPASQPSRYWGSFPRCPFKVLVDASNWMDIPENYLNSVYRHDHSRATVEEPYLLSKRNG